MIYDPVPLSSSPQNEIYKHSSFCSPKLFLIYWIIYGSHFLVSWKFLSFAVVWDGDECTGFELVFNIYVSVNNMIEVDFGVVELVSLHCCSLGIPVIDQSGCLVLRCAVRKTSKYFGQQRGWSIMMFFILPPPFQQKEA